MLDKLSAVLPQLALIAVIFTVIGWNLRGLFIAKPAPPKSTKPVADKAGQDRAKNLEAQLEKSKAAHKSLKAELEMIQSSHVAKEALELAQADLATSRAALETESKRISTLEADYKKSQETLKVLNARANEVDKTQKERSFALENELSKAREQLVILQNRPDDTVELQAEIERLRESVAASTRYAGEVRKRESAAIEALEKAKTQIATTGDLFPEILPKKIGPIVDSGRIAAAKAEVIRLSELNKQAQTARENEAPQEVEVASEAEALVAAEIESQPASADHEL
jgi:DNA repair exonuclease SbcCD ATPase subunit